MRHELRPDSLDCLDLPFSIESAAKKSILAWTTMTTIDDHFGVEELPYQAETIRLTSMKLALQNAMQPWFDTAHYAIEVVPGVPQGEDTGKHTVCARIRNEPIEKMRSYRLYATYVDSWESFNDSVGGS